jgi:hypothetical protein
MGITPMDEKLVKITGAREPSGIPIIEAKVKAPEMPRHKVQRNRKKRSNGESSFKKASSRRTTTRVR